MPFFRRLSPRAWMAVGGALLALAALGLGIARVSAGSSEVPPAQASPLHPTFALLDAGGVNVLESGAPVSTMQTCGQCHDTEFIAGHSYHADVGLGEILAGQETGLSPSGGMYGQWDPLTYRYLSRPGDERFDLGTPEWVLLYGPRHAGGGPAVTSRSGEALLDLAADAQNPDAAILDPQTGQPVAWDWRESGVIEMNCFLCHTENPNNAARLDAIRAGNFGWANTATLAGSGLLSRSAGGDYIWNPAAFDAEGKLLPQYVTIQDPTNANCAACHGTVQTTNAPLTLSACNDLTNPQTALTGQVISPRRINQSGVNLAGKDGLSRSWDIHAERQLDCTDCHFSLNNPVYYTESTATRPPGLIFDPRRLELGEYLQRPDHNFARGQSAQYNVAPELKGTMRRCDSCHDALSTHADWLPYTERHMEVVACESCHIPQLYAPAIQSYDWTVLTVEEQPAVACRGVEGLGTSPTQLVSGYQPVLLLRQNVDGDTLLAPYNLITVWYWVYEDAGGRTLPVRQVDLRAAYFVGNDYAPEILSAFDSDGDGRLSSGELVIDSPAKQATVAGRLSGLGLRNPRIVGQVYPYSVNHNVAAGEWALEDCETCHTSQSRLTQPIQLAAYAPYDVDPELVNDTNVSIDGQVYVGEDGALYFRPDPAHTYIFGHSRVAWVDWTGGLVFLGVLGAVAGHSGLRFYTSLRRPKHTPSLKRVYMYEAYERLWHWLQTLAIVLLLFSGLIIHRPDLFGIFSFRGVVVMHNVLAVLLALNAALSLFYHLASGKIKQFLPRPRGFFDDAIRQGLYYLRGIFRQEPHPFEKSPERKMNPLQQVTYVAILNILLPLQGLTGILMWGVQRWPQYANLLGGLPGLAPFHTLIAWLFAAFIVAHVYLTTTGGPRPLDSIKAMVTGWEEVEAHPSAEEPRPPRKEKK